jgi:type II secretory pathway pseudopilin PulG
MTEVLVVLLLAGMLAGLAFPALRSLRVTSEAGAEARRMYAVLRTARWKAISAGARTRVLTTRVDSGGISYVVQKREGAGWKTDGDIYRTAPGLTVDVTGPAAKVFTPRGTCSFGGIEIRGRTGVPYRLSLNPATGRVRLRRGGRDLHEEG